MFKLVVLAALLAVAAAEPGIVAPAIAAYSAPVVTHGFVGAPVAVAAPIARVAAPVAFAAPIARVAIPAPTTYIGAEVRVHAEPLEQHGYKIAY